MNLRTDWAGVTGEGLHILGISFTVESLHTPNCAIRFYFTSSNYRKTLFILCHRLLPQAVKMYIQYSSVPPHSSLCLVQLETKIAARPSRSYPIRQSPEEV
jgi:hypothetical protein